MSPARKTAILAAIALVLVVLNLGSGPAAAVTTLPTLPGVPVDLVQKVVISTPVERLVMERVVSEAGRPELDRWRITTPLDFPADAAQIRSLLRGFGPGVAMETEVDEGNLENYGLDDQHGKLVELFTDAPEPVVAVVIGKPAAGASSFVRIPGSDRVYRADVGGRSRFDRPSAEWRDKVAFDVDKDAVQSVVLVRGTETLRFERGPATPVGAEGGSLPGDWAMVDPPFPIDAAAIDAIVRTLTRVRAGEVHHSDYPAEFASPLASATLTLVDGTTERLLLGGTSDTRAAFLRVEGRDEVFQVSGQVTRQLTQPLTALQDRTIFRISRKDVASVSFVEGSVTVVLSAGEDGESFTITQPPNMDTDQKQAAATVSSLAGASAYAIAPDSGFNPTGARFVLTLRDGRTHTLELGTVEMDSDNQPVVRVRASGTTRIFLIKSATLAQMKKAFGR